MRILDFTCLARTLFLCTVIALALPIAGCGKSDEDVDQAVNRALKQQRERDAQKKLAAEQIRMRRELRRLKRRSRSGGGSGGSAANTSSPSSCGNGVSVNSVTTCDFARNVAYKYRRYGSGSVRAWSPTLGRYVGMYCSGGSPTRCTGGTNALVTIR